MSNGMPASTEPRSLERLTVLSRITHQLLAADALATVVQVVAEAAADLCNASGALVQLIDDREQHLVVLASYGEPRSFFSDFPGSQLTEQFYVETVAGQSLRDRRLVAVEDYHAWQTLYALKATALSQGIGAVAAAPMLVDGAPIGVLWVCDVVIRAFSAEDRALIEALAGQAALAIQHSRLRSRGREAAILEERARLARDLHDSVTQTVFSLQLLANAAHAQHQRGAAALGSTIERIRTLAGDALSEMRALLYELRPAALEDEGLARALERLTAAMQVRTDVPISFIARSTGRLSFEAENATFRIVQEALANAVKYAAATTITVTLEEEGGRLRTTVHDDGTGFDPAHQVSAAEPGRGGMGLHNMRERAVTAGLTLKVHSTPGNGCTIIVDGPILQEAD